MVQANTGVLERLVEDALRRSSGVPTIPCASKVPATAQCLRISRPVTAACFCQRQAARKETGSWIADCSGGGSVARPELGFFHGRPLLPVWGKEVDPKKAVRLHRGDIMSVEKRSALMSRIRGKGTKPELVVAGLLASAGA